VRARRAALGIAVHKQPAFGFPGLPLSLGLPSSLDHLTRVLLGDIN
jgi:hypothetical protein